MVVLVKNLCRVMSVKSGVVWTKEKDVLEAKFFLNFGGCKKSGSGEFLFVPTKCLGYF